MASQSTNVNRITFSVRVYQLLLRAYPTKFQQEYGSEMAQVFQDCCLRAIHQGGTNGMLRLWAVALLDLVQSVISEHAQKEVQMKKEVKPEDIRMAGWALIWGAVAFVMGFFSAVLSMRGANLWGLYDLLFFLGMPLVVVGLLGVRNRYGEKVGWFGKNILLLGVIMGPLTSLIGLVGGAASRTLTYGIGPVVLFTGLTLFGFVALYKKPLPRWNVAPVLAGIGSPATFFLSGPASMFVILIAMQGIALAAIGYILKSDVPEEIDAPT